MRLELLIHSFLPVFAIASLHLHKRDICTVESFNDPLVDDGPRINEALVKCGDTGRIVLPVHRSFNIRAPIDLSLCKGCDFQINGVINISPDWDYWEKQIAVFRILNTTTAIIRSDGATGVIDAHNFGWVPGQPVSGRTPRLFSISDASYHILISGLTIRNVPGLVFEINSGSSAVRVYDVNFEDAATVGYLIEQAQHVYLWNNTIKAIASCVSIAANSSNIQVEESTCITTGVSDFTPNGIELRLLAKTSLAWIRNVFVRKLKAVGNMNVIAFLAGQGCNESRAEVTNATFTDITIEGPARQAVHLGRGKSPLLATDVSFTQLQGEAQTESDLHCLNQVDVCKFETADWNLDIGY